MLKRTAQIAREAHHVPQVRIIPLGADRTVFVAELILDELYCPVQRELRVMNDLAVLALNAVLEPMMAFIARV
jgi:hypothetical protein